MMTNRDRNIYILFCALSFLLMFSRELVSVFSFITIAPGFSPDFLPNLGMGRVTFSMFGIDGAIIWEVAKLGVLLTKLKLYVLIVIPIHFLLWHFVLKKLFDSLNA